MFSITIPVYLNADSLPRLISELEEVGRHARQRHRQELEVVFVVDGSPDTSIDRLQAALPRAAFRSQLLTHSRNFGSFAAIRTGLQAGNGQYFAVISADLQEPTELLLDFIKVLSTGQADVVIGRRATRSDPMSTRLAASVYWNLYRRLIIKDLPTGGVDVFACTRRFRDELIRLPETQTSLIGQLYWMGFRRSEVVYERRKREHGTSAWTFRKKLRYLSDSVFAFTDLPIRVFLVAGAGGLVVAITLGVTVLALKLGGFLEVPGYAATMLAVLFFGALNAFGLGIVGSYAARSYENSKGRPIALVGSAEHFSGVSSASTDLSQPPQAT